MTILKKKYVVTIVLIMIMFSCGTPHKVRRVRLTGKAVASWYGRDFHGRATASGEIFNMYEMTCAHKTLPLGTLVKIESLETGKSVVVRVNDRGPFVRGRDFDLSYGAARKLGLVEAGVFEIYFECIDFGKTGDGKRWSEELPRQNFAVQIGSFSNESNARELKKKLSRSYSDILISSFSNGKTVFYRVRVGCYQSKQDAEQALIELENEGYPGLIVALDDIVSCP
ncbi:septal ring lytic transglycosylase RlpA family protein [bacterium]|nr:septal ring lytic transglycosylase RlpA family protein [bacterium]